MQSSRVLSRERIVEELVHGRRLANQLKIHLEKPLQTDRSVSKDDLSEKILESFRKALSLLSNCDSGDLYRSSSSHPTVVNHHRALSDSTQSDFSKSENLGSQRKINRKRKITSKADIVEREEPFELMDDGHMWRKYGQKNIQKYKHPRSYYRCTYSEETGCEALKHVQQISDNPPIYKTTCFGRHSCDNSPKDHSVFVSDYDLPSNLIRFDKFEDKGIKNEVVEKARAAVRDEGYSGKESWPSDDFPMFDDKFDLGAIEFDLDEDQFWIGERVLTHNAATGRC